MRAPGRRGQSRVPHRQKWTVSAENPMPFGLWSGYNAETIAPLLARSFPGVPMVRWIAFDDDTAEAVVSRLRRGAAEIQHTTPVDAALGTHGSAMLVLPSPTPGKLLVARFSAPKKVEPPAVLAAPKRDSVLFPASMRKPVDTAKKPWWRNIVA
jgi:hypothetical protein